MFNGDNRKAVDELYILCTVYILDILSKVYGQIAI